MPLTEKQFNKAVCILKNTYDELTVLNYLEQASKATPALMVSILLADTVRDSPYVSVPLIVEELKLNYDEAMILQRFVSLNNLD